MPKNKALLYHAAEEAAELAQALLKYARGDGSKDAVTDEAADCAAFLFVLDAAGVLKPEDFSERCGDKLEKFLAKYVRT